MATFPEVAAQVHNQSALLLRRPPHQRLLLTVHNPRWLLEAAGPLAPLLLLAQDPGVPPRQRPVQLLALAPCGAAYTQALVASWVAGVRRWLHGVAAAAQQAAPAVEVPWIVPLTPWAPPGEEADSADSEGGGGGGDAGPGPGQGGPYAGPLQHLCIQGNVDPARRDYAAAFAAAGHPAVLGALRARRERLLLVGSDQRKALEVPAALRPLVEARLDLDFGVGCF